MIELLGVSYEYEAHGATYPAIYDLSLSISPGEFVTVLGHNGSGKTTFTRLLNGLLRPASGSVLVDGMSTGDAAHLWEIRTQVGMVFATPDSQLLAPRVDFDVAFGLESLGTPSSEIRIKVREALQMVGLEGFEAKDPQSLSGGQKQRVALAGTLALSPRYLVLDEATAMLDPRGQSEVIGAVRALAGTGIAVIFATHSMELAALSDRVLIFSEGRLIADGIPSDILTETAYVEQLGAALPPVAALALTLQNLGLPFKRMPLSAQELVEALTELSRCK